MPDDREVENASLCRGLSIVALVAFSFRPWDKWYLLTAKFFRRLPNERITDGKVPRTCADGREKETIHLVWQMHSRPRFHLGLILAVPI